VRTLRDGGGVMAHWHGTADVAVIGSGFGGALTALALRRMNRSVVLLERGAHPRFAIGESSTPLANLLLEEICDAYGLGQLRALSKWGTWRRQFPEVGCGLKRGFSFYHHELDAQFEDDRTHARQLLVAASPHAEIADTHWYRADVDSVFVREAERAGAVHLDRTELAGCSIDANGVTLRGTRAGGPVHVRARFVVDASGPRGFLHRTLGLAERPLRWLPATEAVYTHFENVARWDGLLPDDTAMPPYPVDLAALHHVFPGGWIWVLRFENGITSAGAALTAPIARAIRIAEDGAWDRLLERLPSVAAQFRGARPVRPFVHTPRLAFRSGAAAGRRWALLPSAAGVVDPLLSTGFPLTLLGIQRLLAVLDRPDWNGREFDAALAEYADHTIRELDATELLVGALYASMQDFALFKRLSLLYFAAASFSETVRRLGMPARARGFLLCDDPQFGPELRACAEAAVALTNDSAGTRGIRDPLNESVEIRGNPRPLNESVEIRGSTQRDELMARIDRAIEPFDVSGLMDRARRDWYPVIAGDLIAAAPRLGAAPAQIELLLERCGFGRAFASTADVRF
jgi:FADH2 O2-dependent halogenase